MKQLTITGTKTFTFTKTVTISDAEALIMRKAKKVDALRFVSITPEDLRPYSTTVGAAYITKANDTTANYVNGGGND